MIGCTRLLAAVLLLLTPGISHAGDQERSAAMQSIRANLQRLSPRLKIDAIRPLPGVPGLFEVRSGRHIFYTDADGRHAFFGSIVSTKDRRNLTAERLEEINRVPWKALPLEDAIVSGDPKGTPIAVFTDPDCPFCRRLERELSRVHGLKVYTFLFPLEKIHPRSRARAEAIWCASNRHRALLAVMLKDDSLPEREKGTCPTPIDRNLALGSKLGVRATPTIISHDGRVHAGVMSAQALMAWAKR